MFFRFFLSNWFFLLNKEIFCLIVPSLLSDLSFFESIAFTYSLLVLEEVVTVSEVTLGTKSVQGLIRKVLSKKETWITF